MKITSAIDRTAFDLALATIAKVTIILAIYFALFAGYDGRPVNIATHLLGPAATSINKTDLGP